MSPERRKLQLRGGERWRRLRLNRHFAAALTTTSIASRVTLEKGVPFSKRSASESFPLEQEITVPAGNDSRANGPRRVKVNCLLRRKSGICGVVPQFL